MNFKKGYKIKPQQILFNGRVVFTDGTNEVVPNQKACEAYGYTYDRNTGSCVAYLWTMIII